MTRAFALLALVIAALLAGSGHSTAADSLRAVDIAAGTSHTCLVTSEGGVKCWGLGDSGRLGHGSEGDASAPADVEGLESGVREITAGYSTTCAILLTGGVKCWGANDFGELGTHVETLCGDPADECSLAPVDIAGLQSGVESVTSGDFSSCAVTLDRRVLCWGIDANNEYQFAPVEVDLGEGALSVAPGAYHACAVTVLRGVKCWGANDKGQLGDGQACGDRCIEPVAVSGLTSGVAALASGTWYTCALTDTGAVKCWGDSSLGALGDGTNTTRTTPVQVVDLDSGVTRIAASNNATCALLTAGSAKCWGYNGRGNLGNGGDADTYAPTDVTVVRDPIVDIVPGSEHTCAILAEGGVRCWGHDFGGTLGNGPAGDFEFSFTAVEVSGFEGGGGPLPGTSEANLPDLTGDDDGGPRYVVIALLGVAGAFLAATAAVLWRRRRTTTS